MPARQPGPPAEQPDGFDQDAYGAERVEASDQAAPVGASDDAEAAGVPSPRTDVETAPATDPAAFELTQRVTSPPLAAEPWAGLPSAGTALAEPPRSLTEPTGSPAEPPHSPAEPPHVVADTSATVAEPAADSATHREGHRRLPRSARRARTVTAPAPERHGRRAAPRPTRTADRRRPVLGGLLAAVLAAVLVLGTLDLVRYARTRGTPAVNAPASQQAVTAAVNAAKPLLAYDYRTPVAQKVAATAPLLTASCAAAYTKDLKVLASTLNPLKVVETAQVNSSAGNAGIQKTAKGRVTVLIFAVQTATNSRVTAPSVTPVQVSFTMVRPGSTWLVDGVVAKGSGGSNSSVC